MIHRLVQLKGHPSRRIPRLRYTNTLGTGWTRAQGLDMKRAIEQETLHALVETGAALAFADEGGAVLRNGGDQGADRRAITAR